MTQLRDIERAALLKVRYATRYYYMSRPCPAWFKRHSEAQEYWAEQRASGVSTPHSLYDHLVSLGLCERDGGHIIITEKGYDLLKKICDVSMCGTVKREDTVEGEKHNKRCAVCDGRAGNRTNITWRATRKLVAHAFAIPEE